MAETSSAVRRRVRDGRALAAGLVLLSLAACGQQGGGGVAGPGPEDTVATADAPAPAVQAPAPPEAPVTDDPATPPQATDGSADAPRDTEGPAAPAPVEAEAGTAPGLLRIPGLALEEELIDLGLAADGSMQVPTDPDRAGWFTGGGRPGGPGPLVLAGHVDSDTGPAVFAGLTALAPGDLVQVEREDGVLVTYEVTQVEDYSKGDFPTPQVFGSTMGDTLRLITCTGPWDSLAQSYEDNRVVYAEAVTQEQAAAG